MKILVLGHMGMLGNAVHRYLSQFYTIDTIDHRWPSENFINYINEYDGDFIINCIGVIPQKNSNFGVNSILPVFLEKNCKCTIIHPSTDCESDNTVYGISKRIASDWILNYGTNTYIIKTSIIGIELNSSDSLLCWFLKQSSASGYLHAKWNGITTLEWAKQCKKLIEKQDEYSNITILSTDCISKFELLNFIKEVFNHNIEITPVDNVGFDKCLDGDILLTNIKDQLFELKDFYER